METAVFGLMMHNMSIQCYSADLNGWNPTLKYKSKVFGLKDGAEIDSINLELWEVKAVAGNRQNNKNQEVLTRIAKAAAETSLCADQADKKPAVFARSSLCEPLSDYGLQSLPPGRCRARLLCELQLILRFLCTKPALADLSGVAETSSLFLHPLPRRRDPNYLPPSQVIAVLLASKRRVARRTSQLFSSFPALRRAPSDSPINVSPSCVESIK